MLQIFGVVGIPPGGRDSRGGGR